MTTPEPNKFLWLDFDETLVSSYYIGKSEKKAEEFLNAYNKKYTGVKFSLNDEYNRKPDWFVSFLRPWTHQLISYFHSTMGEENVGILSWGTEDYVYKCANLLEINILPINIFGSEWMGYNVRRFDNMNMVLLDNENYEYHTRGKVNKYNFLKKLPENKLVEVEDFSVQYLTQYDLEDEVDLLTVIENIEAAFDS
jgi:hypothetical protein